MNINATSTTSSASSNGLSGMISGLDTDSMVESMLSNVQSKIDKQTQQQQILGWKQDMYREVITKINDFQDKYLSLTSSTSLRSTSLFNTMTGESDSSAVKIISAGNTAADFDVQVNSLATAASVVSNPVSTGEIICNNKALDYERKVTFSYKTAEQDVFTDIEIDLTDVINQLNKESAENSSNTSSESTTYEERFVAAINEKLNSAGINVIYNKKDSNDETSYDTLTFSGTTLFKISGTTGGLGMLGYTASSSASQNKDESGELIADKYTLNAGIFNPNLKLNGEVTISLDGSSKKFILDEGETLLDIKDDIEKAFGSGILITEDTEDTSKFKIVANGVGRSVSVTGSDETLKTIGLTNATSSTNISITSALKDILKIEDGTLTINGTEIEYSADDTIVQLLSKVNNSNAGVKMAYNTLTDSFSISNTSTGADLELNISDNGNLLSALGFETDSSVNPESSNYTVSTNISTTATLKDILKIEDGTLTINGTKFEYSANDTIVQLLSKVNNSSVGVNMEYNTSTNLFSISNTSTSADLALNISDNGNLLSALGFDMTDSSVNKKSSNYTVGKNADFTVNGTQLERAGNTVSYGGVTFEMKSTTTESVNITSEKNVDQIVSVLKDFVNDYNTLIADLNKYTHEKAEYKDYPPLTSAQKKEMTEDEIKLWEEKSKVGLLRNDSDISSFLQDMRAVLYTKGSDTSLVLSNIGIDSSSEWKDYGKLSIDENTLRTALEGNSTAIIDMFTNVETGIGKRLNDVCKETANTSSGSPGSLVSMAGVVGKATENNNTIYDRLQKIAEKLENLKEKYEAQKEKYWNMFNTMETSISNYTSQSDYLSQLSF